MNKDNKIDICDKKLEYGRTYYFDKTGIMIKESEIKSLYTDCTPTVEACCRLELPDGFKFSEECPGMCFDLSDLSCIKTPVIQNVTLPTCENKRPMKCEVVAGYEIRVVGNVHFAVSSPICPKKGKCFPVHAHVCCDATAPVNHPVAYTCCPNPCDPKACCIDWNYAYFTIHRLEDCCGPYLQVNMGVVLQYDDCNDCDEE